MNALEKRIKYFNPDVIMLDPFVELHTAEENDNTLIRGVMARFRQIAKDHNASEVILHHNRKGITAPGDPESIRGAGSIVGAGRVALTVTIMSEEEATQFKIPAHLRRDFFRLDDAKKNYSRLEDAEWFERVEYILDNEGDSEPGDNVAAVIPWKPQTVSVTPELLIQIEKIVARGSPYGPWSPRLGKDRRSVIHALVDLGVTDTKNQRSILDQMLKSGMVTIQCFGRKRHSSAEAPQSLRTVDGKPDNVEWVDGT